MWSRASISITGSHWEESPAIPWIRSSTGPEPLSLKVTSRLSFVLSGAQVGITVTALLAGYVAQPYLGRGLEAVLGSAGLPRIPVSAK